MALVDEVSILVSSGDGGDGCVSFRREKYIPFGGPNGGNGGKGGDISLVATRDKTSLLDFKYQPRYIGTRGEHGMGKDMYGRSGENLKIYVPLGTLVFDEETDDCLADLTQHGDEIRIAQGGTGGRGNLSFKSSTNRAPRTATKGEPGVQRRLRLELKLIADIGLIGLPNAGKSSFLSSVSRARPKVADYPFTTLEPHLGVVSHQSQTFVIADLPGLIEGASAGAGLGIQFLRHVARNRMLLHLVDLSETVSAIEGNIRVIREELRTYDAELAHREECLVFTKIDLLTPEILEQKRTELAERGLTGFFISNATREGIEGFLNYLAESVQGWKRAEIPLEIDTSETVLSL